MWMMLGIFMGKIIILRGIQLCYIQDCKEDVQDFLAVNERAGFNKKVLKDLAKN